ncbi:hypothetical protein KKI24_16820 [bacterium]|nr:hypothetical protein [bacterium]
MSEKTEKNKSAQKKTAKSRLSDKARLFDEFSESTDGTITIESLYYQLQSLKLEIDIDVIQNKIKKYDRFFKQLGEDEETLLEMISWFKKHKTES